METTHIDHAKLGNLLKILSKPDAIKILFFADQGIRNSTHAIEELGLSSKSYYTRMKALREEGLVIKSENGYRQTALGNIFCSRFLPAMGRACDSKDKLELLMQLGDTQIENSVRTLIEEELNISGFEGFTKLRMLEDYEALALETIDLYDSAEESVLLASNYFDVRVMEAVLRTVDRGIICRCIVGKKSLSSKTQSLKMMLSLTFTKAIIDFTSSKVELKEFVRFVDLPYTFGVMDGKHNIIDISDTVDDRFIVALSIDDSGVSEGLTNFFEKLWDAGEYQSVLKILDSLGTKLNGKTSH